MHDQRRMPTVLVVEDDEEMNELERELLAVHGFASLAAYTGRQAVDMCRESRADAILLDVMLPQMDGFQACSEIRRLADGVPIIMLSALGEEDSRRRGLAVGANAYFTKPFNPQEIVSTLHRLIQEHCNC
jgi:two-component system, OmpR family, response regulator ResD